MKTCKDCVYRGIHLTHLDYHSEVTQWISCKYDIPWHVTPSAVPYLDSKGNIITHECKTYRKICLCPNCNNQMDAVEVYGCYLCGYSSHE